LTCAEIVRNVLEDDDNFFFGNVLIKIYVVEIEGYQLLLSSGSHEHLDEKLDKLIVINSFVTISVDLFNESIGKEFWKVKIPF
jgi:hypothetical protein